MSPRSTRRRLPSPAMIVAIVALVFASTGSAFAAAKLITGSEIARNTITGANVRNGSLQASDLSRRARAALKGARGATGAVGPAGATGPAGAVGPVGAAGRDGAPGSEGAAGARGEQGMTGQQGPQGEPGLAAVETVLASSLMNSEGEKAVSVECPAGKRLLGGGADVPTGTANVMLRRSYPDANEWFAEAQEVGDVGSNWRIVAYAICARVGD